jgi:DNA-binding beta-propeller fold protein YncE
MVLQLSDSNNPFGECVDKTGDVFVAEFGGNAGTAAILEYAHGGTSPIATLSDPGYHPESCSIDPTTGNLAVTNDDGPLGIYTGAKGDPAYYADPKASRWGIPGHPPNAEHHEAVTCALTDWIRRQTALAGPVNATGKAAHRQKGAHLNDRPD